MYSTQRFIPKEVSWLSFNARVLQEAANPQVPLISRIRFLGIYSSNMNEFFEVRVATLKRLSAVSENARPVLGVNPHHVLKETQDTVLALHSNYEQIYHDLMDELAKRNISFVDETGIAPQDTAFINQLLDEKVRQKIFPIILQRSSGMPALRDRGVFLYVRLVSTQEKRRPAFAVIEIPTDSIERFILLPKTSSHQRIMMLDDLIRYGLPHIFASTGYDRFDAYDFKLTRDAELDLSDDLSESLLEKIDRSVQKRKTGKPVRLEHDENMPQDMLEDLYKRLGFRDKQSIIPGKRYHNLKDFMKFPDILSEDIKPRKSLQHPDLALHRSILSVVAKNDVLLHYPFHSFNHFIDLLREASLDPATREIKITLYRVARNSSVVNALINAVQNGKKVTVVLELQARFDEMNNIQAAQRLKEHGAKVLFGALGLKVHSKLLLIERNRQAKGIVRCCAISTGNFNEETAKLYTDLCLISANSKLTAEVARVFGLLGNGYQRFNPLHLLVSPYNLRNKIYRLIRREINKAKDGKAARIDIKINNLSDRGMAELLYKASAAGVRTRLIVRSMFSVVAGVSGLSENIEARSIVDKYLEHSRILMFGEGEDQVCYISSADLLPRNLDRRIEVACPVLDSRIRQELRDFFEIYWKDNVKARVLDARLQNAYYADGTPAHRSQEELYTYLMQRTARCRDL